MHAAYIYYISVQVQEILLILQAGAILEHGIWTEVLRMTQDTNSKSSPLLDK